MDYAEVAVNAPTAWPRTFTYRIPPDTPVSVGSAVLVPFGPRLLQGIVFDLVDSSPVENTRDIAEVIDPCPLLTEKQVLLAKWISEYYLAPYFESAALMLPPGFERRTLTILEIISQVPRSKVADLTPVQKKAFRFIEKNGPVEAAQLARIVSQKRVRNVVNQLVHKGLVSRKTELQRARIKPKSILHARLVANEDFARNELARLERTRSSRQTAVLRYLLDFDSPVALSQIKSVTGASPVAVRALERKGLVSIESIEIRRDPLAHREITPVAPPKLTPAQEVAWQEILSALDKGVHRVFLLHGITGSGKTEIYLRALEKAVSLGKRGIVLVPEIALTTQTIDRFASRFPAKVAVLHSKLSPGEQFDEWHLIREGMFDVVIGSRSAVFAPQPNLGLIVIDEEHEWTYKQHDKIPLYHARDVSLRLAELTGAVVILGSATPDLESYRRAQSGLYHLLELPERVAQGNSGAAPSLPFIEIVDLKEELRRGNRSVFSRRLAQLIGEALAAGEQVILFLNRRGGASFVQCRDCGYVMRCRRCDVALTQHIHENELVCHICNYRIPPPGSCPNCWSRRIKFLGIGTQKLEEETSRSFPQARILRWDRDVTKGKYSHEQILDQFASHEADILIGTQMIAKGLDIPLVTLVGIINADIGLYLPDFRAGERTFQLLSQVTGRAGRGSRGGYAVIQTYAPEHYAIVAAAHHDYREFYEQEASFRYRYGYPPFNRIVLMTYVHTNAERCQEEAARMVQVLSEEQSSQGIAALSIIGPSPAYTQRIRGRYRWQITLIGPDPMEVVSSVPVPQGWTVDVDPVGIT